MGDHPNQTTKENVPDPLAVLGRAIQKDLVTVLVIGIDKNGVPYHAGTTSEPVKIRNMIKGFNLELEL